jgi:3-hydroxyisobutyrate dehydrogenase-like beta-hydroxyacid dehydrogenase
MERGLAARERHGEPVAGQPPPRTLLIGYGAVGRALAARLAERGALAGVVDPAVACFAAGGDVMDSLPPDLSAVELVLAATPASAAVDLAQSLAGRAGRFLHVDLSSAAGAQMAAAARAFDADRFVDGAIMGAVDLHGADTPILLAGEAAGMAARLMQAAGLPAMALPDSRPGDASAVKLLRSVVTKGLEAVAVEAYVAARRLGLEDALKANLADISRTAFPDILDSMVRTHPAHALRRAAEVEAAVAALEAEALPAEVARAVLTRFRRTAARIRAEDAPTDSGLDKAVDWLRKD